MSVTFACRALQVTRKVDILTPLGALYYNTGRYEEALQVYKEAAALQPDSTDIWLALVSTQTPTRTRTHTDYCNTSTPFAPYNVGKTRPNGDDGMLEHLWLQFRKAAHLTSSPKHLSRTNRTLYLCARLRF